MRRSSCPYNRERPHQGIGNLTPADRYPAGGSAAAGELELAEAEKHPNYPPHSVIRKVAPHGVVAYRGLGIILGKRWAGARVRIVAIGELLHIYLGEDLLRVLVPDWTTRYQKLDKP